MIPDGWESKELADLAHINMGQSPKSASYNEIGEGLYLIQGNADIKNRKSVPRTWTTEPTKICNIGDILMTVRAPVGAIALSKHKACIGRGVCSIRGKKIDNNFLYQYLIDFETKWKNLEQGSTFTAVGSNEVKGLKILLPPLPEQKKIASILSSVDKAIQATQKVIDQTEKVKKGLLQELLTKGIGHSEFKKTEIGEIPVEWEVGTLGSNLIKIIGGGTPSRENPEYWNGNIPWATVKDLTSDYSKRTQEYITEKGVKESSTNIVPKNTIITATRMGLGRIIKFSQDVSINQDLKALFPKTSLNNNFLFQWFKFKAKIIEDLGFGSTVKGIRLEALKAITLLLPPLSEQKQIASILSSVDKSIQKATTKKEQLLKVKKGLMQDLLTGKVRVKV